MTSCNLSPDLLALAQRTSTPRAPLIADFGSWFDYVDACAELSSRVVLNFSGQRVGFRGADTWQHALSLARSGDEAMTDAASRLIENMSEQGFLSDGPSILGASEAGFMPLVPAVLSGDPQSMLTRVSAPSSLAPIKVVVACGAGETVPVAKLVRRGAAVAALVLGLSARRPVELYGLGFTTSVISNTPCLQLFQLDTRPADVASITFALSSAATHRAFAFVMADHMSGLKRLGATGRGVPYSMGDSTRTIAAQSAIARHALGLSSDDLYIPRVAQDDDQLLNDPERWVKDKLAEYAI